VTGEELERYVLAELRSLPDTLSQLVAQHLVMVGRCMAEDPAGALAHAAAARDLAPRVALLRETYGVACYAAGDYPTAVRELRAAHRISGNSDLLPMIADCERGLGRPEKALEVLASAPPKLGAETAVELLIVGAGARRDLGDPEAAVLMLQRRELQAQPGPSWLPRLRFAYADALAAAGRPDEAARWFALAEEADLEGELDWPDEGDADEAEADPDEQED
jgi:tetratricopeptide (TPR) repeat protein